MIRNDGSIRSANFPSAANKIRDYGIHKAIVRAVYHTDDDNNDSGQETVYDVCAIGGDRCGQMFHNARVLRTLGGWANYEETVLKAVEGITGADPASIEAAIDPSINSEDTQNGDTVYIQFLSGDLMMPLIVGMAHHKMSPDDSTDSDGQIHARVFNGCKTVIDADGIFTFSKDNGALVDFGINPKDPKYPYVNQFAPLPGQAEAFKFTLDNDYTAVFEFTPGPTFTISGGTTDSFEMATFAGTTLTLDTGIAMADVAGDSLDIADGTITLKNLTGDSLEMSQGAVTVKNTVGAKLVLDSTGFVKLGNSTGDALVILKELIKSLSTASYSGFGAPGSNVADLIQLLAKIQLITGG